MNKVKEINCVEIDGVYVPEGEACVETKSASTHPTKKPIYVKLKPDKGLVNIVSPRYRHPEKVNPQKEFIKGFRLISSIMSNLGKF